MQHRNEGRQEDGAKRRASGPAAPPGRAPDDDGRGAAAAGVSQTTVSLVLNNSLGARLSAATRQRVRDAARDARLHAAPARAGRAPTGSARR